MPLSRSHVSISASQSWPKQSRISSAARRHPGSRDTAVSAHVWRSSQQAFVVWQVVLAKADVKVGAANDCAWASAGVRGDEVGAEVAAEALVVVAGEDGDAGDDGEDGAAVVALLLLPDDDAVRSVSAHMSAAAGHVMVPLYLLVSLDTSASPLLPSVGQFTAMPSMVTTICPAEEHPTLKHRVDEELPAYFLSMSVEVKQRLVLPNV